MAKIGINLSSGEVNEAEQKELIIGIDLGTTNSLVAYTKNGEALTVKDQSGKNSLIPSVIHFESAEKVIVGDAAKEKLDYVELRFSPYYMGMGHKLAPGDVVGAVVQGVRDGQKQYGVKANLIGILSRTFGVEVCHYELDGLLAHRADITALDLAGDELGYPAELFVDHFRKARDADWRITVHAGEADGPDSITRAINLLGAERIGHGVAAIYDPSLMQYLAENQIPIESCPTSNYQTATVSNLAHHPMKRFILEGMCVTLNTDDPGVSAIDLANEYRVAQQDVGLTQAQLTTVQRNGVHAAFLSDSEKRELNQKYAQ